MARKNLYKINYHTAPGLSNKKDKEQFEMSFGKGRFVGNGGLVSENEREKDTE